MKENSEELIQVRNSDLWKIYDSSVGNRTIKGPNEPGQYSIIHIEEAKCDLLITWGTTFEETMYYTQRLNAKPLLMVNCMNYGHPNKTMEISHVLLETLAKNVEKTVYLWSVVMLVCIMKPIIKSIMPSPVLMTI